MASHSYSNLLDLATGAADQALAATALGALRRRRLPRVITNSGFIDDSPASPSSTPARPRTIIVANQLPIQSRRPTSPEEPWTFEWDEDSLLHHLHHSSSPMEFIYARRSSSHVPQISPPSDVPGVPMERDKKEREEEELGSGLGWGHR